MVLMVKICEQSPASYYIESPSFVQGNFLLALVMSYKANISKHFSLLIFSFSLSSSVCLRRSQMYEKNKHKAINVPTVRDVNNTGIQKRKGCINKPLQTLSTNYWFYLLLPYLELSKRIAKALAP